MFKKQGQHSLFLAILLLAIYFISEKIDLRGELWGISSRTWLWIAIVTPVLHQVFVVVAWRAELHHQKLTEWFGDKSFPIFKFIFTILIVGRPITLILLGVSNSNTFAVNRLVSYSIAAVLFIPFAYTMYSVVHYFGINRAYGEDHFNPSAYKNKSFVKQGMFKYTNNAMYKFGFLGLWVIGFLFSSQAVLLAAAFNYLYIWVHFYFTELPDIKYIYGDQTKEPV